MIQIVSHASFVKRNKRSKVSSKTSNLGTFKNASACKKCLAKVKIELQDYIEEKKKQKAISYGRPTEFDEVEALEDNVA
jgi:hypothetical protein